MTRVPIDRIALPEFPTIQDRYKLRELLGEGTSGTVHRALDRLLGRVVALKLMHSTGDVDVLRRFRREAKIAASIRHPDVIEVFDVGDFEGRPFLVMELVTAPTLARAVLEEVDPPTIATAVAVAAAIATTLAAVHAQGVVHRDLKPANVFVEGPLAEPRRCRIADFGLAFMTAPSSDTLGRLTLENALVGTPLYMAPEQAAGGDVGPPADVYSLGCILHELLSGRPPFIGNLARVIAGHTYLPPIGLREFDAEVPVALERLVLTMLAKAPAERPTAQVVVDSLRGVVTPRRARSATMQPRSGRAFEEPPTPSVEGRPLVVAIEVDDPALVDGLRGAGVSVSSDAAMVLVDFEGLDREDSRVRIALHPSPSAADIASAIRRGAVAVIRWPGSSLLTVTERLRRCSSQTEP